MEFYADDDAAGRRKVADLVADRVRGGSQVAVAGADREEVLFVDTYPTIGKAAVRVLEAAAVRTVLADSTDSDRSLEEVLRWGRGHGPRERPRARRPRRRHRALGRSDVPVGQPRPARSDGRRRPH